LPEVRQKDWLEWHSARTAQDCALRLTFASSAVLPSDKNLQQLASEQITADLIAFAVHARRLMERRSIKATAMPSDPLWPSSAAEVPSGFSLWDICSRIVHAKKIEVVWEKADLSPNPYQGREPKFAGSCRIASDEPEISLPIGPIPASFFALINGLETA
jgi:hypothetical protein